MYFYFIVLYFFIYGFLGWCTEVAYAAVREGKFVNRGFLNGPICPIYGIGVSTVIHFLQPVADQWILLYILSTILVTVLEGITGFLLEKLFHHRWWDYSGRPLNIGGYVCLLFSLLWGVACVVIVKLIHPVIHGIIRLLPPLIGIILMVICSIVMFADLAVTINRILRLNRQLDAMEKISAQLCNLSEKLGENIYENVMDTREVREKVDKAVEERKERIDQAREEQRAKIRELRQRYSELSERNLREGRRLFRAFPKLRSQHHREILEELKERMKKA